MRVKIDNIKQDNIIIFDIEYDQNSLVQIAFLWFARYERDIFELKESVNKYIKQPHTLNPFFVKYTGITDEFLREAAVSLNEVQHFINTVLMDITKDNCILVSHGIKNDLLTLAHNGINWNTIKNQYCTYNRAKQLLKRNDHLTLTDVAAEGGYCLFNAHNAYADVWGTFYAFCYLKELENENL